MRGLPRFVLPQKGIVPQILECSSRAGHSPTPPPAEMISHIECAYKQPNRLSVCVFSHHRHRSSSDSGSYTRTSWVCSASILDAHRFGLDSRSVDPRAPPRASWTKLTSASDACCSCLNSRSADLLLHGECVRGTPTITRLSLSSELQLGLAGLGWHPTRMQVLISATQLGLLGRHESSRRARSRRLCCQRCLASDRIW